MEEFSPSLAKEFLVHLKAECSSLAAIGDLAVKLKTLQIVFDITSATKYFDSLFEKLKRQPLYNIDRDVDYGEWANLDGWVNKVERIWWNSSESHGYKPDGSEKKEAIDTIYMSSRSFVRDKKESKAIIDEEKSKIHSAIDVLLSDVYFGSEKIDVAINNSLHKLSESLNKIDKVLKDEDWTEEQYSIMVNDILKKNGALRSLDPVFVDYNNWRKKYNKLIDVPMLKRKLAVELKELFDSKFIIYDIIEIDKQRAETYFEQAEYNLLDNENNDDIKREYTRIYFKLRLLIDYKDGRYNFDDLSNLGMYIFQNRHSLKDEYIDALVKFIKTATYIYEDIDRIEGEDNKIQSVEELKCSLSEDKINLCYFKSYKEIWLAIIEKHINELRATKALWVSVYYVLCKYKMIDDNSLKFCDMIKEIFNVELDNSNFRKDWNKYKDKKDYNDWDVNNKSSRKRDLAKEIDLTFKTYYQSKTGEILKTIK